MSWRVVSLKEIPGVTPDYIMGKVAESGCIGRSWSTPHRGPMAFVAAKRVLGVAELVDIFPIPGGSHLWKFSHFRDVGDVECGLYTRDRVEGTEMPVCLNAWAQHMLNKELPKIEPEPVAPAPVVRAPAPVIVYDPVEAVGVDPTGQLTMF